MRPGWFNVHTPDAGGYADDGSLQSFQRLRLGRWNGSHTNGEEHVQIEPKLCALPKISASSTVRTMLLWRGNVCGVRFEWHRSTIRRWKHQKSEGLNQVVERVCLTTVDCCQKRKMLVTSAYG
jgi:hypothetical protein